MKRFAYTVAAVWTPHGHAIQSTTKASDEAEIRNVIEMLHGERAAAGAHVWEIDDKSQRNADGKPA